MRAIKDIKNYKKYWYKSENLKMIRETYQTWQHIIITKIVKEKWHKMITSKNDHTKC